MNTLAIQLARIFRWLARRLESFREHTADGHRAEVQATSSGHDMAAHPDEAFYAEQYLHWIVKDCGEILSGGSPEILDLGCGYGRLALPLAERAQGGRVTGVDFTGKAITGARHNAKERGLSNVTFKEDDVLEFARAQPDASYDVVIMLEVAFFLPTYQEVLQEVARILKPGGLLFASFWSQHMRLLKQVKDRDWNSVKLLIDKREGHFSGTSVWFSWHTGDDVRSLLKELGLEEVTLRSIGLLSGIEGDPLTTIARPSHLSPADRTHLLEAELQLAESYSGLGRYILARARKRRV